MGAAREPMGESMNEALKAARQRMKLGKTTPAKLDPRTLELGRYTAVGTPAAPKEVDWSHGIKSWGMMGNDDLGDCTCAAVGHMVQEWTANASVEKTIIDDDILRMYSAVSGWSPDKPNSDNGACMLDVLNYWRKNGVPGEGDKIAAYVALNHRMQPLVQQAVGWFGGIYVGLLLPLSAQDETVWSQNSGPDGQAGSWGGHCVAIVGYDGGGLTCITWGALQRMTWGFFSTYCDEAYAVLDSPDWLEKDGKCPAGLNLAQLQKDLKVVTG